MPKYEDDIRAGRFESNIRHSDLKKLKENQRIYICQRCHRIFEERSRYCPVCETKTMGEIIKFKN